MKNWRALPSVNRRELEDNGRENTFHPILFKVGEAVESYTK